MKKRIVAWILTLLMIAGALNTCAAEPVDSVDPIALVSEYWTEGSPAAASLNDYLTAVTDSASPDYIPVEDRIAVFDLDGTLMCETYPFCFEYMLFADYALNSGSDTITDEVRAVAQEIVDAAGGEKPGGMSTRQAAAGAVAYRGMTMDGLSQIVRDFKDSEAWGFTGMKRGEAYYRPMVALFDALLANDFAVYIVTATERNIVRAVIEGTLDIPPSHVIGTEYGYTATNQGDAADAEYTFQPSDQVVFDGNYYGENAKMSKVDAIVREIGQQPVLAFGNSSGDLAMEVYTITNNPYRSAAYMVLADDEAREYGDAGSAAQKKADYAAQGIGVISMRDDFATIYGDGVAKAGAAQESAEVVPFPEAPVVGIAWRADTDSEFFTNVCRAVEEAGGTWVLLDQVTSADLAYDDAGKLTEGVTALGSLDADAAKYVRLNTWHGSNAAEAVGCASIVLFTGGEDISSTLFFEPEPWHGIVAEIDYNAERDVSDYLTMSYCLDNDIPVMGFCRGMQMLGVISGAEMIQDIPAWFAGLGVEYDYTHRNQKATPEAYRDYAAHDVEVAEGSLLHDIVGRTTLTGCPSWHHQAIGNVDNTRLIVTGTTDTNGVTMIEAVERTDKTFAVGLQFHPEAALVKHLDGAENRAEYMDYDTALAFFRAIVEALPALSEAA